MADVIIIPDFEEGHIFPTFKMARNLARHGISVGYLGIADVMQHAADQGFENDTMLEEVYPKGFSRQTKNQGQSVASLQLNHFSALLAGEVEKKLKALQPKLILCSYFISLEALLLHYKYKIPQAIYHTFLPPDLDHANAGLAERTSNACVKKFMELSGSATDVLLQFIGGQGVAFASLKDLVDPFRRMPQFMLCPREFRVGQQPAGDQDIYIGPCIREASLPDSTIRLDYLPSGTGNKRLIFASLGSQTGVYLEKAQAFFKLITACMAHARMEPFHLILSVGTESNKRQLGEIPANVSVFSWVPQVEILKHVSLAIIHGGLGSIKECIYEGVPMLIVPMGRDQMDNALRVKHHNLGYVAETEPLTVEKTTEMLVRLTHDQAIAEGVARMKRIFHQKEEEQQEVHWVKKLINK